METCIQPLLESVWLQIVIAVLVVWEMVWKLIAMWKAAGKKQLAWFLCIAIFNTVGILPIIYLIINKSCKPKEE